MGTQQDGSEGRSAPPPPSSAASGFAPLDPKTAPGPISIRPRGGSPLSPNGGYALYEVSPRQFGTGRSMSARTVPGPVDELTSFPHHGSNHPTSSYSINTNSHQRQQPVIYSKPTDPHSSFGSFPSESGHPGRAGSGSAMDGWGATVDAPFGGGLDSTQDMTAFGSLPTFDHTTLLAHRSSFDPPSSASSFGSERPGTAGGASALISMSRSGGQFGSPATYGLVEDTIHQQSAIFHSNQMIHQGTFAGGPGGVFVGGGGESSSRSSPYDGSQPPTHPSPSSAPGPAFHPHQHAQFAYAPQSGPSSQRYSYLQQFDPNRYPTPPVGLSPSNQTQPPQAPAGSSSGTDGIPLYMEQQSATLLSNSSPYSRRASESQVIHAPFHPAQASSAFQSPSNTPPGANTINGHLYSTPSTSSLSSSAPHSVRAGSSARRPSSSSSSRRPNGASHAVHPFDLSTGSLQTGGYLSRPQQQQSAQSQRMHAHPYAHPANGGLKRRDSTSATTSSFAWDIGGPTGSFTSTGGSSMMRPQTSDGIPGSALHGFSDFPANMFYQASNPQPAPNPAQFISPSNLTGAPHGGFGASSFDPSSVVVGSEFPLQQPIFAGPISSSGTPSGSYLGSNGTRTPSQSRPSTAPSLGLSSSSVNPRQLLPASASIPHPRPTAPAPAFHQLLTSTPQDGKSKAKAIVRDSKRDNISPVTGRPKRPRRKHEEVERLYECLAGGCGKSYGTLNHLNQHILTQSHGEKRTPAEFRDLRRAWRRKRKEQNAAAAAAQKANGKEVKFGGLEKRPSNANKSTAGGRRRSSTSAVGGDDSEDDEDEEALDEDSDADGSSSTNPRSSVSYPQPSVLVPSVFSSYPPGSSSSTQHTPTFAYDPSQAHPAATTNGHSHMSGPLSPLDPLLPFFSGGPPSSTTFSPAPTFSTNINATPDFNHWAFSDPLSSTPGSGTPSYRGSASGLVHHTGFSPLAGLGVAGHSGEPPSPLDHQGMSGLGRRGSRRRGSVVGTIQEVGEVEGMI